MSSTSLSLFVFMGMKEEAALLDSPVMVEADPGVIALCWAKAGMFDGIILPSLPPNMVVSIPIMLGGTVGGALAYPPYIVVGMIFGWFMVGRAAFCCIILIIIMFII